MSSSGSASHSAIIVTPPTAGFDRAGIRTLVRDAGLATALHKLARAPFGHTVLTLRALDAMTTSGDLALQAGEALHAALLEDIARTGTLAIPEPTADQRLFIGAFTVTVLCDVLIPELAALAPTPQLKSDLELDGIDGLLEQPPRQVVERLAAMSGRYLEIQAQRQGSGMDTVDERAIFLLMTLHAFFAQLRGAVERLTHIGRLRPFGIALAQRKVVIGELRYHGFQARAATEPVSDLKPVKVADIVGNKEYIDAGLRLARDVAAYDLENHRSPKRINPVLFGLGRPGCGKTITAHAIGNYFLNYCQERDVPARFKVIRRTDWASSYQNASASALIKIFKEEVYAFDGVCGVYWPDIDTAFASRGSGDLRIEEKNNLGAVFGIFDGTLLPKDGKWFMMCDANYMQMDEATRSRIAQNPFTVKGPTSPADYVKLLRDILLGDVRPFISADDEAGWHRIGEALVKADLSGRSVESIAGNIRSYVQDFEYPDDYFKASYDARAKIIEALSKRVSVDDVIERVDSYVRFGREAEDREAKERFDREVSAMVEQLNAGREATRRAAEAVAGAIEAEA
ncbi:MAG: AAA family ATPase [Nannocystaceae bacterium]